MGSRQGRDASWGGIDRPGSTIGKLNSRLNWCSILSHLLAEFQRGEHCCYHDPNTVVCQKSTDANSRSCCQEPQFGLQLAFVKHLPASESKIADGIWFAPAIPVRVEVLWIFVDSLIMRYSIGIGVDNSSELYQYFPHFIDMDDDRDSIKEK